MLSPRLKKIADIALALNPRAVCDVGTDHALIPIHLTQNGISGAIATDINVSPLEIARENIAKSGLSDVIQTRLGCGLEPVMNGEADLVIIAGMGGLNICDILSAKQPSGIHNYILQPMKAANKLRRFLVDSNFCIVDEELVIERENRDGARPKLYNILLIQNGHELQRDELSITVGAKLIEKRHPLLKLHLENIIHALEKKPHIDSINRLLSNIRNLYEECDSL